METPRIGISSCLLGEKVRYNGQHQHDRFLTETLGKYVDYVPVCPEVECGLPIPRPAMRLVGDPDSPRLMTSATGVDLTDKMMTWVPGKLNALAKEDLAGFIFKARSPSSGMERVKVYNGRGGMAGRAPGIFAGAFMAHFPLLPVEDNGRLHDPDLREHFIERIFTLTRYREAMRSANPARGLDAFHSQNKLLIMSHSPSLTTEMGRIVAGAGKNGEAAYSQYEELLLRAIKLKATIPKHVNVLQHIMGYFKKILTSEEKKELLEIISSFRQQHVPLIVPVTILSHYARKYGVTYLTEQFYLHPHPLELKLRNHA